MEIFKQSQKHALWFFYEQESKETIVPDGEYSVVGLVCPRGEEQNSGPSAV